VLADVGEEELEAVGRTGDRDGRHRGLVVLLLLVLLGVVARFFGGGGAGNGRTDLEAGALELARQLLGFLLVEVLLGGKRLDRGRIDVAALLRPFDDRADLIRLEKFL
jgi:hypothetical protein